MSDPRPPFGPKRIGWGYRPQTAQGWLIMLGFLVVLLAVVAIVAALAH